MRRIRRSPRYLIEITGPDLISLGKLGGDFQCFGKFSASERTRTMKIGRYVRDLHKLT